MPMDVQGVSLSTNCSLDMDSIFPFTTANISSRDGQGVSLSTASSIVLTYRVYPLLKPVTGFLIRKQ